MLDLLHRSTAPISNAYTRMSQCVEQLSGGGENNVYNDSELVGMSPFLQLCLSYDSGNFIDYHIVMTAKIIDQKLTPKNDQLTLDLCNEVREEGSDA